MNTAFNRAAVVLIDIMLRANCFDEICFVFLPVENKIKMLNNFIDKSIKFYFLP